jgi:hypothetical protein
VIEMKGTDSKDPERKDKKRLVETQTAAPYLPWQALALIEEDGDDERVEWKWRKGGSR